MLFRPFCWVLLKKSTLKFVKKGFSDYFCFELQTAPFACVLKDNLWKSSFLMWDFHSLILFK